jgi:hypothetical protein
MPEFVEQEVTELTERIRMLPTSVASVSSCKKVFSLAPTPVGLVGSLFNESVPSHSRVGGGSTTLVGQLPIETKCPDPPTNLFPRPVPGSFASTSPTGKRRLGPVCRPEVVSRPIGACGPDGSQIRAACRGSFPPIEKLIPITAGDPKFVPAGDLFPGARIQSLAAIAPGVVNFPVVRYLFKSR